MRRLFLATIFSLALSFPAPAWAQNGSPVVTGMVPSGANAILPNAAQNLAVGNYISPQMCGAAGNDSTDDTAAIVGMFTVVGGGTSSACPNFAGGGSWSARFPHTNYKVTSQITVDIGTFANNLASDGLKVEALDGGFDIDGATIASTTISSGTYNSGTGAVSLTLAANSGIVPGQVFYLGAMTGTGSIAALAGGYIATSGTTGTTVNFTATTGLTLTISGGTFGVPTFVVLCTGVANGCDNFVFGQGGRVTIKGNNPVGPVYVLGNPALTDQLYTVSQDYVAEQNFSSNTLASGAQINNVTQSRIRFASGSAQNGGGATGYGVQLVGLTASDFTLTGGWPGVGLDLEGADIGNRIFYSTGGGATSTGLKIGNANAAANAFIAPDLASSSTATNAAAGSNNLLLNPYFGADASFFASGTPLGMSELDSTIPYGQITATGTVTTTLSDPDPYREYDIFIISAPTSLTIQFPRCGAGSDGKKINVGTASSIATFAITVQTTGNITGVPASLSGTSTAPVSLHWKCRGGEGTWRPI